MEQKPIESRSADPNWAWAPYLPDPDRPWELKWAGHLYRRAAFGGTWSELQEALRAGPQKTVDKLVTCPEGLNSFNASQDQYETSASSSDSLRGWWLRRICQTPWPLLEQMTLFWHNHFALSNAQLNNPALMCRYVRVQRQHALGNFGALLENLSEEPAFFACLDSHHGRQPRPGQNVARVLLEHYTLGSGKFTESDVQTVTKAFSGWFVSQNQLRYSAREHNTEKSSFLGQTADHGKQDVVRALSRSPATALHMVRELYRWFVSETTPPSEELLAPLAESFGKNLEILPLVQAMLRSNLFFCRVAYRQKIKSPVDFALSLVRPLQGTIGTVRLGADLARLGQDLCQPPTVEGWAGCRSWINEFTLAQRGKLAAALVAVSGAYEGQLNPHEVAASQGRQQPEDIGRFMLELLLQGDVAAGTPDFASLLPPRGVAAAVHSRTLTAEVAALAEFQLA